jgi:hypothetical protein
MGKKEKYGEAFEGKTPFGRPRGRQRIISKWIITDRMGTLDCLGLAKNRDKCWVLLNTELIFGFYKMPGILD